MKKLNERRVRALECFLKKRIRNDGIARDERFPFLRRLFGATGIRVLAGRPKYCASRSLLSSLAVRSR